MLGMGMRKTSVPSQARIFLSSSSTRNFMVW